MVAGAEALEHGHPAAAQDADLAGLGTGRELERLSPSSVGTVIVAPSAACVIVRSTVEIEVVTLADEARIGQHAYLHVEVAARAPFRPACPSPLSRIRWPSWIPGGISTSSVRSLDASARCPRTRGRDGR